MHFNHRNAWVIKFHITTSKRNCRINQDWQNIGYAVRHHMFVLSNFQPNISESWRQFCLTNTVRTRESRTNLHIHPTRFVAGLFICDKFVIQSYVASGSEWRWAFFVISASKQTMPVVQQLANKPVLLICPRQKQSGQHHRMGKGLHLFSQNLLARNGWTEKAVKCRNASRFLPLKSNLAKHAVSCVGCVGCASWWPTLACRYVQSIQTRVGCSPNPMCAYVPYSDVQLASKVCLQNWHWFSTIPSACCKRNVTGGATRQC